MTEGKSRTVSEFGGIEITSVDDVKGFKMTQDGMVNKILKICDMEDCESGPNPTSVVDLSGMVTLVRRPSYRMNGNLNHSFSF